MKLKQFSSKLNTNKSKINSKSNMVLKEKYKDQDKILTKPHLSPCSRDLTQVITGLDLTITFLIKIKM